MSDSVPETLQLYLHCPGDLSLHCGENQVVVYHFQPEVIETCEIDFTTLHMQWLNFYSRFALVARRFSICEMFDPEQKTD